MTWSGWKSKENYHVLVNQFHGNFCSKTLCCRKIKYVFRDVKWSFNASWGLKGLIMCTCGCRHVGHVCARHAGCWWLRWLPAQPQWHGSSNARSCSKSAHQPTNLQRAHSLFVHTYYLLDNGYPASTIYWPNAASMLAHLLWSWPNIKSAFGQHIVFTV